MKTEKLKIENYAALSQFSIFNFSTISLQRHYFLFRARSISTAIDTVAPTIGLLPMPRKPIISTWAGTELEPAN